MRIISGKFKGKRLYLPNDKHTRPLKDIVKESIFNLILHSKKINLDIKDTLILDLFSGSGSFGIECISREAKKVTFIENYEGVLPILKKNLLSLNSIENYEIIEKNIYKDNLKFCLKNKFDLIFLDPPYKDKNLIDLFTKFENLNILTSKTIIILHRHKNEKDVLPNNFNIIQEKKYGISKISFISYLK